MHHTVKLKELDDGSYKFAGILLELALEKTVYL